MEQPAPIGKIVHDRPPMLAVGVMIWLGSELMFFSGLFAAFFTIRADAPGGVWPPPGTHLDTVRGIIFTLVLVSSSFSMQWAVRQVRGLLTRDAPTSFDVLPGPPVPCGKRRHKANWRVAPAA